MTRRSLTCMSRSSSNKEKRMLIDDIPTRSCHDAKIFDMQAGEQFEGKKEHACRRYTNSELS